MDFKKNNSNKLDTEKKRSIFNSGNLNFYYFFAGLFFSFISAVHCFLNFFDHSTGEKAFLYSTFDERRDIFNTLFDPDNSQCLINNSIFKKSTFFKRKKTFNKIIRIPFTGICLNEYSFYQKLLEYHYKNYFKFLKRSNFQKIIMYDEYSAPHYALITAAKNLNCKVISLQHGIINENHSGYIIPKKYKDSYNLPDYLLTYGNYEKELLTKMSIWEESKVIPLGCPRYDPLSDYSIDEHEFREKYNIPKDKKILFWPTQTHDLTMSKNGENEVNAECVFKALNTLDDWFLIIKFHPNENEENSFKFYNGYKEKYNVKNCLILKYNEESTYDCIKLSECVIQKHSTVGMESILLNTPLINFELIKSADLSVFRELKSNLIIQREEDLAELLINVNTKEYIELFHDERKKFLGEHFCNFGHATEKISEYIKSH